MTLQQAAQAIVNRWDTTDWRRTGHTAEYILALRKALDAEIQQAVDPVAWMHPSRDPQLLSHSAHTYGSASVPLYTHPAPQLAMDLSEILAEKGITLQKTFVEKQRDHVADTGKTMAERAELIAELRARVVGDPFPLMDKAANMLAADAQQGGNLPLDLLERLSKTLTNLGYATPEGGMEHFGARIESQLYNLCRGVDSLLAQQVAVPPGYALVPIEPTRDMITAGAAVVFRRDDCEADEETYRSRGQAMDVYTQILAAAPQPPQGDKP